MSIEVRVITNEFGKLAGEIAGTVENALDLGVVTCLETADPLTRVDTGAMRANKTISGSGTTGRTITWNQPYSAYHEFGTYKMSAQPFAKPGMDAALPAVVAALGKFGR